MKRDSRVDVFRGAAILMIIALHACMLIPEPARMGWGFLLISRMSSGVQLFFLLSGYLICQSWDRLRTKRGALRIYLLKRAAKIAPLYFIFIGLQILGFFLLGKYAPDFLRQQRHFVSMDNLTLDNLIIHAFFLQGFFPKYIHSLLDGSWSIVCEVYFYLIFPVLLAPLSRNVKSTYWLFIAFLTISMYALFFFDNFKEILFSVDSLKFSDGYRYYFFLTQAPIFIFGMFLFRIESLLKARNFFFEFGVMFFVLGVVLFFGMLDGHFSPLYYHYFYAFDFGFVFLGSISFVFNEWNPFVKFFSMLGRQSYALFLLHIPILRATSYWLSTTSLSESVYALFFFNLLLGLSVSIALSVLVFNRVDLYFVGKANVFARRWRDVAPACV